MTELPDQRQLWDAYGHALGAIGGVELLLRIALINKAVSLMIEENDFTDDRKASELAKIQGRTLGPTIAAFKDAFPEFADDQKFCESMDNALYCRNQLAHHFVENNLLAFRSEEGIELATLGCYEHVTYFQSLDRYLREHCTVDFDAFFALGEGKAVEFVEGHPLREKLQAIKARKLQPTTGDFSASVNEIGNG